MNLSANSTTESCQIFHELYPDPTNTLLSKLIFGIFYSTIFVLGVLGNISVIFVTLTNHSLQTVQNIFILNLAVADIFVCFISLPITPIANIYKAWYFGAAFCRLIPWVQGTSLFISTFTLTAIALDRYVLIVHPHKPPLQRKSAFWLILLIWIISGGVTVPYAYYMQLVKFPLLCGVFCDENWPANLRRGFTFLYLFAQFVLPFLVISLCYFTIFKRLRTRINNRLARLEQMEQVNQSVARSQVHELCLLNPGQIDEIPRRSRQGSEMDKLYRQKRRTTIILGGMVLVFAISQLPTNVTALLMEHNQRIFYFGPRKNYVYLVHLITHCFAMTSILANPILYAWLNEAYRSTIIKALGSSCCQDKG